MSNNVFFDYGKYLNMLENKNIIETTSHINYETNITILVHLYHSELFDEFLKYIKNVKKVFKKVIVIFTININSDFDKHILSIDNNFIIIKVENKGVDVYGFLKGIQYIKENNINCDYVLKLHTKISNNPNENNYEWRKELIEPIVDYDNLLVLQHYFKKMKNIGYVGCQKCILPKNFDLDFPQNIDGLNELISKFTHLPKDWGDFNGGNIFWINYNVLNEYLTGELNDYLISRFLFGKPPCNLRDKGIYVEYLCERLFTGVFCYNKTNILINNYKGCGRGISKTNDIIDNTYFYQPSVFSFHNPNSVIKN
jgi:hypothetical protein